MANPHRGEVTFKVADKEYILKFSTNAICELEGKLEKGLNAIVANMDQLTTVRALLWAGLREKHPDVKIPDAGNMIDCVGMAETTEAIGKALNAAYPTQNDGESPNA